MCFRETGLWRCLNSKNVMIVLYILNFHRRIKIFCSGEHFDIYTLVWCSWNCLGHMQGLHICFDIVFVCFFCFLFFIIQNCMWLSINLKKNNKTQMSKHMQIYEYSCSVFKRKCLMRSASHLLLRPVAECYTYIYIYIYIYMCIYMN